MSEPRYQITRRFEFDAAHRLKEHTGKCRNLHGHRYVVEVVCSLSAEQIQQNDEGGMVMDFGIIKKRIGDWIDRHWDHHTLYEEEDWFVSTMVRLWLNEGKASEAFCMMDCPPTAENMAFLLYEQAVRMLPEVNVDFVTIWETPNCRATYPMAVAYITSMS